MPIDRLLSAFEETFGGQPTVWTVAPGRVNLIGEHTDYNDGFVFPAAIDVELTVAAKPAARRSILRSLERGEGAPFDVRRLPKASVRGWAAYAAGMAWVLHEEGFEDLPNIEAVVTSGIPIGSGVSSSAALELAFGVLWNEIGDLGLNATELAKLGQKCENLFVGLNCGIMDQMASARGKAGHAMFLDTRSLELEYAPIPEGLSIVLCDTKKPRALTSSAYNERRSQCEEAAKALGVRALRDATVDLLESHRSRVSEVVYRRARHVVGEDARSQAFKTALARGDRAAIGDLMADSHVSLRDDYEVSCTELDVMAEAAWETPGCVGARMTGAGFGGACVALVETPKTDDFVGAVGERYEARTARLGAFMVCRAVDGARVVCP